MSRARWPQARARGALSRCGLALSCFLFFCCHAGRTSSQIEGSFGVFFGGEIQRLEQVVWDGVSQVELGFRLELPEQERAQSHQVRWELVRPGPAARRITLVREFIIEPGRQRLDEVVEIPLDAPLGTINMRVLVDGQLIIDRALVLRRK